MMKTYLVSVVIPTCRRPALLLRCLRALLLQDFPANAYEIIVVSDGADPVTSQALEKTPLPRQPLVQYYSLPGKAGPAAARNLGWLLAQSDLVAFTDDDCIPDNGWLKAIWAKAQGAAPASEVAFSGRTVVPISMSPTDYERNISHLASAEFITANCACSLAALKRVGGFDERFKMAWREDSDLQFKFIKYNIPIVRVSDAVVTHPVRKAPWGVSIKEERKGIFNALLYKKFPDLYRERIQRNPPWHYYAIAFFLILFVTGALTTKPVPRMVGLGGWVLMTSWFTWRRLRSTSRSWSHVSEMIFTSAVIPVVSLFWKFYGSLKFKALVP